MKRVLPLFVLMLSLTPAAWGREKAPEWVETIGAIAVQDSGRTMPLDTYAKNLAVQLTGRAHWKEGRGPNGFSGKHRVQLLCDLLLHTETLFEQELITIEDRPLKTKIGLDPKRKFFSPVELANLAGLREVIDGYMQAREADPQFRATKQQQRAMAAWSAVETIGAFAEGKELRIVPSPDGPDFLSVGLFSADPGAEDVQAALAALRTAYVNQQGIQKAVTDLVIAIKRAGTLDKDTARRVSLEVFYNNHRPWMQTAFAYGLAIVLLGLSRIFLRRTLLILGGLAAVWGTIEQIIGLYLRTAILGHVPVSNTYESLLWIGLIAVAIAGIAQAINRKGWYMLAGLIAAELSVLFSMLVPLESQTNALPPVLRSNYWLILHVLTIVASYGALVLAGVLGHVYLIKAVLLGGKRDVERPIGHPIITQIYRTMQVGLVLLTIGTILGGVWAADSWGRFWGWDPKETWALISIIVYFILLHARHIGWLRDFGLAVSSILAFLCIVWTFYGVNYVMASGLHSYGFGSGGEVWVAIWALAELVFLAICRMRYSLLRLGRNATDVSAPHDDNAPTIA